MIVLEIVADDLPGRARLTAQPFPALGMLVEPVVDRLAEADRRVRRRIEQRLDRVVLLVHAPIGVGVLLGEFSELFDGPLDVLGVMVLPANDHQILLPARDEELSAIDAHARESQVNLWEKLSTNQRP